MKWIIGLLLFTGTLQAQATPGFTKINTSLISGSAFTDAGCPNQNTCYYQVTAADINGHESPPALCDVTVLCFALNQAVAVMPSSGTHNVNLTWIASTSTTVSGYNAYRSIGPLSPSKLALTVAEVHIEGLLDWEA